MPLLVSKMMCCLNEVEVCRLHLKCDGTRAETRFCLPVKRTNPFQLAGVSVQSDRLCGLVVRVSGYRYRGLGFDSRRYQIF